MQYLILKIWGWEKVLLFLNFAWSKGCPPCTSIYSRAFCICRFQSVTLRLRPGFTIFYNKEKSTTGFQNYLVCLSSLSSLYLFIIYFNKRTPFAGVIFFYKGTATANKVNERTLLIIIVKVMTMIKFALIIKTILAQFYLQFLRSINLNCKI